MVGGYNHPGVDAAHPLHLQLLWISYRAWGWCYHSYSASPGSLQVDLPRAMVVLVINSFMGYNPEDLWLETLHWFHVGFNFTRYVPKERLKVFKIAKVGLDF